jgi:hypothetical protein
VRKFIQRKQKGSQKAEGASTERVAIFFVSLSFGPQKRQTERTHRVLQNIFKSDWPGPLLTDIFDLLRSRMNGKVHFRSSHHEITADFGLLQLAWS